MPVTPNTPYPEVGGLYGWDLLDIVPQPILQPGGVGTPVTQPVQTLGEHNGQYLWGCGHSTNMAEYVRYADESGRPKVCVRCSICAYVQTDNLDPDNLPPYYFG